MKDIRVGESLWEEWTGLGYEQKTNAKIVYFTNDHVDLENEIVRRALASTLQRDGIADSLADGFTIISFGYVNCGWSGIIEGEKDFTVCSEDLETEFGDLVDVIQSTTWIEI